MSVPGTSMSKYDVRLRYRIVVLYFEGFIDSLFRVCDGFQYGVKYEELASQVKQYVCRPDNINPGSPKQLGNKPRGPDTDHSPRPFHSFHHPTYNNFFTNHAPQHTDTKQKSHQKGHPSLLWLLIPARHPLSLDKYQAVPPLFLSDAVGSHCMLSLKICLHPASTIGVYLFRRMKRTNSLSRTRDPKSCVHHRFTTDGDGHHHATKHDYVLSLWDRTVPVPYGSHWTNQRFFSSQSTRQKGSRHEAMECMECVHGTYVPLGYSRRNHSVESGDPPNTDMPVATVPVPVLVRVLSLGLDNNVCCYTP